MNDNDNDLLMCVYILCIIQSRLSLGGARTGLDRVIDLT